ncbi:hypothetical protein E2C01_078785 [Portunus trituberculatus]|uniref:Uncharacterized protein n=1 Tax=Portunus trituberculatus TaxID=210409 RepID=A0A5B7IHR9_PORTR|nr:hypothetical protein [Portunus trituberculatus]
MTGHTWSQKPPAAPRDARGASCQLPSAGSDPVVAGLRCGKRHFSSPPLPPLSFHFPSFFLFLSCFPPLHSYFLPPLSLPTVSLPLLSRQLSFSSIPPLFLKSSSGF